MPDRLTHWRVGSKVTRNVYCDDKPVAMLATESEARALVAALNSVDALREQLKEAREENRAANKSADNFERACEQFNAALQIAKTEWEKSKEALTAAREEIERLKLKPSADDVLRIRCLPHQHVPQFNTTVSDVSECGACIAEACNVLPVVHLQVAERELAFFTDSSVVEAVRQLQDQLAASESARQKLEGRVERLRSCAGAFLGAMATCHICKGSLIVDEGPAHCEDCSGDCDDHDEPSCESLYGLYRALRRESALNESAPEREV